MALLYPSLPTFVKPSSVVAGKPGSTTFLYWPSQLAVSETPSPGHSASLTIPHRAKKKSAEKRFEKVLSDEREEAPAQAATGPQAGSAYGSLAYGEAEGYELRPAIRVSGSEPAVSSGDLTGVREGNIVIEVTIDERGNIIQKTVLQSLGPAVDGKVLAALEDWRFLPATRDGVAVASKQDVYYHYPVRR